MSNPDRRAVVIIVVSVAASAAVSIGGYESRLVADLFWIGVAIGLVYLFWPDLPQRVSDRFIGDRSWKAHEPAWRSDLTGFIVLRLSPPGIQDDGFHAREYIFIDEVKPSVEVEDPNGDVMLLDVRPPHSAATNGVWNDYYFAVYPHELGRERAPRLAVGTYRVVWRRTQGQPGHAVIRIRRFRITTAGQVR
jgi:hypothetical protein